jgi:hypothetical protein
MSEMRGDTRAKLQTARCLPICVCTSPLSPYTLCRKPRGDVEEIRSDLYEPTFAKFRQFRGQDHASDGLMQQSNRN